MASSRVPEPDARTATRTSARYQRRTIVFAVPNRRPSRFACAAVALALAFSTVAAACGDQEQALTTAPPSDAAGSVSTAVPRAPAPTQVSNPQPNPDVKLPDAPATELGITDLTVGTGKEVTADDATKGTTVEVNYVGVGQLSKKVFDSSYTRGQSVSFPLNGVIPGWTQGLIGMKEGGRRQLVIPGSLAYGSNPPSADISSNETLVFIVDLIKVG